MWMIMYIDEESYKTIVRNSIIPACDIICITKDKKILLCLRNNEPLKWIYYIPWWRRYKNEKMIDSAKRKAYEELWLEVDTNRLTFLGIYDDIYDNSAFEWISTHCEAITFVYSINDEELKNIKVDKQHSDFRFFDINDSWLYESIYERINDIKKLFTY